MISVVRGQVNLCDQLSKPLQSKNQIHTLTLPELDPFMLTHSSILELNFHPNPYKLPPIVIVSSSNNEKNQVTTSSPSSNIMPLILFSKLTNQNVIVF
jgi:hypothetical protein